MGSKTFALPSLGKHWSPKLGTVLDFGQPDTADRPRVEGAFCYCPISPLAEVLKWSVRSLPEGGEQGLTCQRHAPCPGHPGWCRHSSGIAASQPAPCWEFVPCKIHLEITEE